MDYDFRVDQDYLRIPSSVYRPVKRCPFCQSVFINEKNCESCGRSLIYHPIGEPFSAKSLYGLKERYIESMNVFVRYFPIFEDKNSPKAKSYIRKLEKRFCDLVSGFNSSELMAYDQRKLFYIESIEIINELMRYDVKASLLESLIIDNDNSLIGQEILLYLQAETKTIKADAHWREVILNYRLWGALRVEYFLKVFLVTAMVIFMAVKYKDIISSQFGR